MGNQKLENLIVQAQVGDSEAYNAIYQRFQKMAFSYAYSILGDYELAEDARQDAFIAAYCDLLSIRNPKAFAVWFQKIVFTHSVKFRSGRRVLTVPLEETRELASLTPSPADIANQKEI